MKGLDVSFSRVSPQWCQRRLSEGYKVFVQCLWTGGYQSKPGIVAVAQANLRDAREAGMITAGYLNTNPWFDAAVSLAEAKIAAGAEWDRLGENAPSGHPLAGGVVFNDVEIPGVTEAQIKAHCEAITGAGKRTAIYSARWFWSGSLGNPQWPWLKDYKIWNAYYDGDPDGDFDKAPWGPWTIDDVIGEQYGGTDIEGVTVDWNYFEDGFFKQEEDMALSAAAEQGIEDFFAKPYTDSQGRPYGNVAGYILAAIQALDDRSMGNLYNAIAASGGGGSAYSFLKELGLKKA